MCFISPLDETSPSCVGILQFIYRFIRHRKGVLFSEVGMAIALRPMMCYDVLEGVGQWHGNLVLFETSPCLAVQASVKPWEELFR